MHRERCDIEQRADCTEAEGGHRSRRIPAQQIDQQSGDQRAVHDQAGIALGFGDVPSVVVNAVAVERQGRVTKQHRLAGDDVPPPDIVRAPRARGSGRLVWSRHVTIDDVVLFNQRRAVVAGNLVLHQNEAQRAIAAVFDRYVLYGGRAGDRLVDTQRLVEGKAAAGPHSTRQRHRRQEAASRRVAVGPQNGLPGRRKEVEPVPEWWQRIPGKRRGIVAVKRRG